MTQTNLSTRKRKNKLAIILSIAFLASVFAGSWVFSFMSKPYNTGQEEIKLTKPEEGKPLVVLIAGIDQRKGDSGRSDSLLLAFIDKEKNKVNLVSIPRDSYVNIPGRGKDKINHSYAFGGMSLTIDTVEEFTNIPINYYVKTNMEGLKGVVDILGGIDIDVPKAMKVGDIRTGNKTLLYLSPGKQTLNGAEVVAYARFRKDSRGDVGRMERQQEILKGILKKAIEPSKLLKAPVLVSEIKEVVETNMSPSEILGLSSVAKELTGNNLTTYTLEAKPFGMNGISYMRVDEEKKDELLSKLY